MSTTQTPPVMLSKGSYMSLGLLATFCGGLFWIATKIATIETNVAANAKLWPVIQQDVADIKEGIGKINGVDMKQQAQIDAMHEEVVEMKRRLRELETRKR